MATTYQYFMTRFTSLLQSRCIVTLRGWLLGVQNVTPVTPSTAVLAHVPFVRTNSTAAVPEEPLYDVDGSHLSKTQVLAMEPVDRSIAAWRILVDWELKKLRPYVMVDPYDPSGLLYLPYHEYVVTMRTLAAARATIILVCRPETQQPKPVSSPKTPPLNEIRGCILDSDLFVPSWRAFTSLREWIRRNINIVAEKGMVKVDHGNVVGLVNLWGRELLHILAVKSPGTKVEGLLPLAEHLQTLLRHCGTSYTIKRMKIYLFVLNSFIGGNPVATTEPFGLRVRLRNGLPAFLARSVRDSLRSKNLDAVRLYASLFSLYKAIEGPHKLSDLSTIEAAPLNEESAAEVLAEFSTFVEDRLLNALPLRSGQRLPGWKYETGWGTVISSAGANSPHAMCSILMDAYAWSRAKVNHAASLAKAFGDKKVQTLLTRFSLQGSVLVALNGIYQGIALGKPLTQEWAKNWGGLTVTDAELESVDTSAMADGGGYDKVPDSLWLAAKRVFPDRNVRAFDDAAFLRLKGHYIVASPGRGSAKLSQIRWIHFPWTPVLGRLHSIPEAAGKVRVVAICDYFTQILCKPIHQFLFKVLAIISMDGTFDQQAAVDSFAKEGHQEIFSYDLTAATDMIPLQLYSIVVGRLIGKDLAQKWVKLLSDRDFLKPRDHLEEMKELGESGNRFVRYSRGQPMGALSSWAGLAIVHHAIILFAADKANLKSSQVAYRVLGDDVIIAGSALALSYRAVCESFGIPIGDYKSYKSKSGLFNFASQTLLGIENVSAVSFKELVQATTWAGRVEMARRILHRYGSSRTSLFRLGVFAPMWQLLTAELSGAKPLHFVRFVRFVLRNPFLVKGDEDIRIDDLLSWLGEISPGLGLVSNEQRNEFESAFKRVLVASILKKWNYLFTGTKKVHGWKEGLKLASPYSEYGGGMELHYITQCYTGQNKRFYQKALRVYRQVTDGLWIGGGAALSLKKIELLSITQLVKVFVYLSSVPTPVWFVRPNGSSKYEVMERVLFDTIGRKDPDEPEGSSASPGRPSLAAQAKTSARATESLRGPTLELTSLVARVFGKVVPVPEVAGLQFSDRWWRHISSALELNIARRAEATASLHLGQVALVPYGTEAMEMVILASPGCYAVVPWNPYPGNRQWC